MWNNFVEFLGWIGFGGRTDDCIGFEDDQWKYFMYSAYTRIYWTMTSMILTSQRTSCVMHKISGWQ